MGSTKLSCKTTILLFTLSKAKRVKTLPSLSRDTEHKHDMETEISAFSCVCSSINLQFSQLVCMVYPLIVLLSMLLFLTI